MRLRDKNGEHIQTCHVHEDGTWKSDRGKSLGTLKPWREDKTLTAGRRVSIEQSLLEHFFCHFSALQILNIFPQKSSQVSPSISFHQSCNSQPGWKKAFSCATSWSLADNDCSTDSRRAEAALSKNKAFLRDESRVNLRGSR